jgi:small subunit ribosomal protein S18
MPPAGKPVRAPRKKVNPLHAKRIKEVDWKDVTLLRSSSPTGKIRGPPGSPG